MTEVVRRLRALWTEKVFLGVSITLVFWIAYFGIQRFPLFPAHRVPSTALDRLLPFQPGWAVVYLSLSLFIPWPPLLLDDRNELRAYAWALLAMTAAGFSVFLLWPTSFPHPPLPAEANLAYRWIHSADGDTNAFPALHGAFALFTALCLPHAWKGMKGRGTVVALGWGWGLGILYATLTTKQHAFSDVLAGAALGASAYGLYRLLSARDSSKGKEIGHGR